MKEKPRASAVPIVRFVSERLSPDVDARIRRLGQARDVVRIAVMPDVHPAGDVCVGMVLATRVLIYPSAVGGDIGCGMLAAAFDGPASAITSAGATDLLARLGHRVPVLRHRRAADAPALPADVRALSLSEPRLEKALAREGVIEFATLGRGNHFLEFQRDNDDRLWLMIHSGSRAMGQAIRDYHVARAAGSSKGLPFLDSGDPGGLAYLSDMSFARQYAAANRLAILQLASDVIGQAFGFHLDASTLVHCDHNHVVQEMHFNELLYVHRKGASPAADKQPGIIPGSMGTHSFHTVGRGNDASLHSSSHGAGRKTSRGVATRISAPELLAQMQGVYFDSRAASRLTAEAPGAYRDIDDVMRAQRLLTRITRKLHPVLVYKGI